MSAPAQSKPPTTALKVKDTPELESEIVYLIKLAWCIGCFMQDYHMHIINHIMGMNKSGLIKFSDEKLVVTDDKITFTDYELDFFKFVIKPSEYKEAQINHYVEILIKDSCKNILTALYCLTKSNMIHPRNKMLVKAVSAFSPYSILEFDKNREITVFNVVDKLADAITLVAKRKTMSDTGAKNKLYYAISEYINELKTISDTPNEVYDKISLRHKPFVYDDIINYTNIPKYTFNAKTNIFDRDIIQDTGFELDALFKEYIEQKFFSSSGGGGKKYRKTRRKRPSTRKRKTSRKGRKSNRRR